MAKSLIPDSMKRRHVLAGELDAARASEIAAAYVEADRHFEALAFYAKAGDDDGVRSLVDHAVLHGDVFLMRECQLALGEDVDAATWERVAEAAAREGKDAYANEARRYAATAV